MFEEKDLKQIESRGSSLSDIEVQINNFRNGFPWASLAAPATPGNGIMAFSDEEAAELIRYYDEHALHLDITKFVPASGAATRMFKHLYGFNEWPPSAQAKELEAFDDKGFNSVFNFFKRIRDFAFYEELDEAMKVNGTSIDQATGEFSYGDVIDCLLTDKGLNYGNLPKGLLKFHRYGNFSRTSLGEHLVEGAHYSRQGDGTVKVHFTVSPEHMDKFNDLVNKVSLYYEDKYGVEYELGFSVQMASTDTIAVDMNNEPFRDQQGSLLFRPGGHGALIENLNDLDTDVIFIKNIDNVVPDRIRAETYKYKKLIGGLLLATQQKIFKALDQLQQRKGIKALAGQGIEASSKKSPETATMQGIEAALDIAHELGLHIPDKFTATGVEQQAAYLTTLLNRPVRVCGMVRNEGEPGGGPFWVYDREGHKSLQIVESSQVNQDDSSQLEILHASTHFNPVDLVCGVRDYKGRKFDLHGFIDPGTGFISVKSMGGKQLKAQELPGLWNGAMAGWITIFVEVPIITFNPVKTVNDLLRDQHQ